MKKANLIFVTLFAIIGALVIYNYFIRKSYNSNPSKKINTDYSLVTESILINKTIDEVNNNFDDKIIFICIKENEWCNYYAKNLNNIANANGIDEIDYLNIKQDRQYNTSGYRNLVKKLENFLLKDDENNLKIFVPTVIFVKKGKVIGFDNETSMITENILPSEYWTDEKLSEFNQKITSFILEYKEEI